MEEGSEEVIALHIGYVPDPAVSGALLFQTEESCFLTFNALKPVGSGSFEPVGIALIEFKGCIITQFGYPNDEAYQGHPLFAKIQSLGKEATSIHEVHHSRWLRQLVEQNRKSFPEGTPWEDSRHFIIEFHDSSFECLAESFHTELIEGPYESILIYLAKRAMNE